MMIVAAALAGSVYVVAQPAPAPGDAADAKADADADADEATPPERYGPDAESALSRMRAAMQKGLEEVKKARQEKDSLRLLCVNEPVTAMKGVLRIAENANVDLRESIATSELAQARREFRKVRQGRRQMDNLLSQTQNCAGVNSSESRTSIDFSADPDYLAIDPFYGDDGFFYDPSDDLINGDIDVGERDPFNVRPPPASGVL